MYLNIDLILKVFHLALPSISKPVTLLFKKSLNYSQNISMYPTTKQAF